MAASGTATNAPAAGSSAGVPVRAKERPATKRAGCERRRSRSGIGCARPLLMCRPGGPGGCRRRGGRGPRRLEAAAAGSDQDNFMSHFGDGRSEPLRATRGGGRSATRTRSPQSRCGIKFLGRGRRHLLRSGWARAGGIATVNHKPQSLTPFGFSQGRGARRADAA
jgi:hypothetical protein